MNGLKKDWFKAIENKTRDNPDYILEDGDAYIGLLRNKHEESFQYWIGMFTPENTEIPEGFGYIDFPKSELGVCWAYGRKNNIFLYEGIEIVEKCNERLKKEGMHHVHDKDNICWAFERYTSTRSKIQDKNGNIIIGICFFINYYF